MSSLSFAKVINCLMTRHRHRTMLPKGFGQKVFKVHKLWSSVTSTKSSFS